MLCLWCAHDTPDPDESHMFLREQRREHAVIRPEENALAMLKGLSDSIEKLPYSAAASAPLRIPDKYDERSRATADGILALELIESLPARVQEILLATGFQSTSEGRGDLAGLERGTLDIVRLLRLQLQKQLFYTQNEAAWQTAHLGLRLAQLLHERTQTFHDLGVADTAQEMLLKAILAGIDANDWSSSQLRALTSLPEPAGLAARLLRAMSSEYTWFASEAARRSTEVKGPLRSLWYQPNRAKRDWLDLMAAPVAALKNGDLVRAYQALVDAEASSMRQPRRLRNVLGNKLVAAAIAGSATPLAQAVDSLAQVRLIKLRSAFSLYRAEHRSWPPSVRGLVGTYPQAESFDPWTVPPQSFRYSIAEHWIYSIGRNRRDDLGRFNNDLSCRKDSDDCGLRLPE